MPLDRVVAGKEVVLECITEGGERDARLLAFMQDHYLFPGAKIEVLEVAPSLGIMNLRVGRDEFALGIEAAKRLRVY
jgi:Fe2+ transport system protein FeoA